MKPPYSDLFCGAATVPTDEATNPQVRPAFRGFGQPIVHFNQQRGSRLAPYIPTHDPYDDGRKLASISAMDIYSHKSHEELRLEDYQQSYGVKLSASGFSSIPSTFSTSTPFGTSSSIFGGHRHRANFRDSKPCFGKPSHNQRTWSSSCFGNSTSSQFGMSGGVSGRFPSNPTYGASLSSSGASVFGPSSSAFGSTTTSAFGGNSTSFPTVLPCARLASGPPIPDTSFSKLNIQETPSFGGSQPFVNNQCRGSRVAPYYPTQTDENSTHPTYVTSISAMPIYKGKSHEELRAEDYQQRNIGSAAADYVCAVAKFGESPLTSDKLKFMSGLAQPKTAGPSTSLPQDKPSSECFRCSKCNHLNFFAQTSKPISASTSYYSGSPQNGPGYHAKGPNIGDSQPPFGAFTKIVSPSSVPFGFGFPSFPAPPPVAQFNPFNRSAGAFGSPTIITSPICTNGPICANGPVFANGPNGTQSISPIFGARPASPSIGFVPAGYPYGQDRTGEPSTSSESITNPQLLKENGGDPCASNGLETIDKILGFNPWAPNGKDNATVDNPSGSILCCEEADEDADIIALAEFAVEQHNAMDKDEKVVLVRVVGAWLEAVSGGRYHIVLETQDHEKTAHICSKPKRYYAAVMRHSNRMSHLTVLEKWLPGKV